MSSQADALVGCISMHAFQCLDPSLHNDLRRLAQNQLDDIECNARPEDFVAACNRILLDTAYGPQQQQMTPSQTIVTDAAVSFCGTALARAVGCGRVPPAAVEYERMHVLLTRHMIAAAGLQHNNNPSSSPAGAEPSAQQQQQQQPQQEIAAPLPFPLRKLHSVALSRVIVACAKLTFPDGFATLFEPFFFIGAGGPGDSHCTPLMTRSPDAWQLVDFYLHKMLTVDELNPLPQALVEHERKSRAALTRVTASIIDVLFKAIENAPGGVDNVPIGTYQALFSIIETLIPFARTETLADRPAMLVTYGLRRTGPDDEELAASCGALFAAMCGKKGVVTGEARGWMRQVLDALDGLLRAERWDAVASVIEGFEELPLDALQGVAPEVADLTGKLLRVHSLYFAHRMLPILNRLIDSAQQAGVAATVIEILPDDLVRCIYDLCPRNKSHPSFANAYRAARMSAEQFLTDEQYDMAFAELRNVAARTLRLYAEIAPQRAAAALVQILTAELRPPNDSDVRNAQGYVTQRSAVFFVWDACLFCVEHLATCFNPRQQQQPQQQQQQQQQPAPAPAPMYLAGPVQPVWDALVGVVGDKLTDAVLLPSYLKMMAALWPAPDVPWGEALNLLLHYATVRNPRVQNIWEDKDLTSARRRALTLLVTACTHHGQALLPFMDELRRRMQALWMSNQLLPAESNHLLEAATALSCFMNDQDQAAFLDSIAQEPIGRVIAVGRDITPDQLRNYLFEDPPKRGNGGGGGVGAGGKTLQQTALVDDLALVTGVLRRASGTNYARRAMGALIGAVTQITEAMHTLHATAPPHVMAAFEVPEETQDAMSGASHRQIANAQSGYGVDPNLRRIRAYVQRVRECCYQLLPIAMRVFGCVTAEIARCLDGMRLDVLPLHVASAAVKHLFTQALELYAPCAPLMLRIVLPLFTSNRSNSNSANHHQQQQYGGGGGGGTNAGGPRGGGNQVYISRQMFFIYKDFMTALRAHVLQKGYHTTSREVCAALVNFFGSVATGCPDVTLACCRDASNFVLEVQDDELAAQLYVALCRAIGTTVQALSQRDRESAGDAVFSVYHKQFARFSQLLFQAFPPHLRALLERFNNSLSTIQRFPPRRNKFMEFCVACVA